MFIYNRENFTIEDADRGIVVRQTGGPGQGVYTGEMVGHGWKFVFLVNRFDIGIRPTECAPGMDPRPVEMNVKHYPPEGILDLNETPFALAREAAIAHEVGFYGTRRDRITTNSE